MTASAFPSLFALAAAFVLGAAAPPEDPPYFTGTVVDALSGSPLAGALLDARLPTGNAQAWTEPETTDATGRFIIPTSKVLAASGSAGTGFAAFDPSAPTGTAETLGNDHGQVRADGRSLAGAGSGVLWKGFRPTPARSANRTSARLAKPARIQGGPPYRVRKVGYETRESRIFQLVLQGTLDHGGLEPDTGLVIPLVPLSRPGSPAGP